MTKQNELRDYAAGLIFSHAKEIEYLTIFEVAEEDLGREIDEAEASDVESLIAGAKITITFADGTEYDDREEGDEE